MKAPIKIGTVFGRLIDLTRFRSATGVRRIEMAHEFGPVTADYRVRCVRCGFEQYSAAPESSIACLSDQDVNFLAGFLYIEIQFLLKRLAIEREKLEKRWIELEQKQRSATG